MATGTSLAAGALLSAYSAASHIPLVVGMLGLFPLFVAIRVHRAPIAALCAAAWGLLLFGQLARWGAIDATLSMAMVFAVAPATHAALGAALTRWIGFSPFALGVLWFGVEFSLSAAGLPRGLFSGAAGGATILGAIAHGLGIIFLGFLAAYVSAMLVCAICVVTLPGAPGRAFTRAAPYRVPIGRPQTVPCRSVIWLSTRLSRAPPSPPCRSA